MRLVILLFFVSIFANANNECVDKNFSRFYASKYSSIMSALEQVASKCSISVSVKDDEAREILDKNSNIISLNNFTLDKFLSLILSENNLHYELVGDILRISYLETKSFKVDYIATNRSSTSGMQTSTNKEYETKKTENGASGMFSGIGSSIKTVDEFDFWSHIEDEIAAVVLQQPVSSSAEVTQQSVQAQNSPVKKQSRSGVVINKNAGIITITGSKEELVRAQKYIDTVTKRLHRQVLIDVNIYSVGLDEGKSAGVDWSNVFSFLNASVSVDGIRMKNASAFSAGAISTLDGSTGFGDGAFFRISSSVTLKDILKFLNTQGSVKSISNPKLLTLNNQPALIFSGETIYYPVVTGGTSASATSGATNPSVVATPLPIGVTLDVTPHVLDSDQVILKINPSASSCVSTSCELQRVSVGGASYDIAPNVSQKQLSSVVKAKSGDRIILGGLIRDKKEQKSVKMPLVGDIPIIGYLFKQDSSVNTVEELVIIITPYVISDSYAMSKSELGYNY